MEATEGLPPNGHLEEWVVAGLERSTLMTPTSRLAGAGGQLALTAALPCGPRELQPMGMQPDILHWTVVTREGEEV